MNYSIFMGFISSPRSTRLRSAAFWVHLIAGLGAGIVLLVLGLSGAALVYAPELEMGVSTASEALAGHQPEEQLGGTLLARYPGLRVRDIRYDRHGNATHFHLQGSEDGHPPRPDLFVLVDPETGTVLREADRHQGGWHWLRELHHDLLGGKTGRKVNGIFGALLFALCVTGLIVWWPGPKLWRKRIGVQSATNWKRFNWDLHNATGFWLALPLAFFAFTGFQFAFPKTVESAVRWITRAPEPPRKPKWRLEAQAAPASIQAIKEAAEKAIPGGRVAQLKFPGKPGEPVEARVKTPFDGHWHGNSKVWLDPASAEVLLAEDFRQMAFGNQVLATIGHLHMGHFTYSGGWGAALRFLWIPMGLMPGLLFLTGFLMWWNRVLSKRVRRIPVSLRRLPVWRAAAALALLCALAWRASGQEADVLSGRVQDGAGAVIADARITLQMTPERIVRSAADGSFRIERVPPATYIVTVEAPGFAPLVAQARPGAPELYRLEPAPLVQTIEVNAGTFDQIRLEDPLFQTGLERSDIATRNNRRLSDVVARMPGVFMSGPPGGDKDVRLRGLDKEFSRTQVDGFMIPDGGEKRELQLNRIPSSTVQSVRIVRNPTAEFESDGLAGRVDVQTRPISEQFLLDGRFGYGNRRNTWSNRIAQGQLSAGKRFHRNFGAFGTFDYFNDVLPIERRFVSPNGDVEADDERQPQRSPNFFGNFGVYTERFGDLHIKPVYMNFTSEKERLREVTNAQGRFTRRELETETKTQQTLGLSLNHRYARPSGFILDTQGAWFGGGEDKPRERIVYRILPDNTFTPNTLAMDPERKADKTWNFNSAASVPLRALFWQEWKFGTSLRSRGRLRDRTRQEINLATGSVRDTGEGKDRYRLSESYYAGFVQNRIRFTDRFSWTPGVRVERVDLSPQSGAVLAPTRTFLDVNPSSHLLYRAASNLSLRAAVSRGLARPKFDELAPFENITATKIVIGNPDLEPSRAWNYDAGADYATRLATFSVNFFHKDIRGIIEELGTGEFVQGRDVFQVRNIGNGWTRGLELEQRLRVPSAAPRWMRAFSFWANETILRSNVRDAQGFERPFKEQPRWIANFGADFQEEGWGTSLSVMSNFISRRFDFKTNGDITSFGGSASVDVALYQRLVGNSRLFIEANNLTNRDRNRDEIFARGGVQRRREVFGRTMLVGLQVSLNR